MSGMAPFFQGDEPDCSEWWEDRITSGLDAHPKFTEMALERFCNLDPADMPVHILTAIEDDYKLSPEFEAMIVEAQATGRHPWEDDRSNVVAIPTGIARSWANHPSRGGA